MIFAFDYRQHIILFNVIIQFSMKRWVFYVYDESRWSPCVHMVSQYNYSTLGLNVSTIKTVWPWCISSLQHTPYRQSTLIRRRFGLLYIGNWVHTLYYYYQRPFNPFKTNYILDYVFVLMLILYVLQLLWLRQIVLCIIYY